MNYSRNKTKRGGVGGEDMKHELTHVLKKEHVEVPGINFNKYKISMGYAFWTWIGI